jgi:hypothetical protein
LLSRHEQAPTTLTTALLSDNVRSDAYADDAASGINGQPLPLDA